ncbi:g9798 [Coccomyxa elongata]
MNLGPNWTTAEAGRAFADSITEMKVDGWEQPPGLGICPLDTLFNACTTIHRWLSLQDDNVAVLHIRGFFGAGLTFLALVVACFSMFNVECRSLEVALAMTPDLRRQRVFTGPHPGIVPATRRQFGEAQLRYGGYFQRIVTPGMLPPPHKRRIVISKITLRGFKSSPVMHGGAGSHVADARTKPWSQWEGPGGQHMGQGSHSEGGSRTFLVIYQRGSQMWADEAIADNRSAAFDVDVAVNGDIVIGLWRGEDEGSRDPPSCAFAFHTAFVVPGLLQVAPQDMDSPDQTAPAHGLFMDVLFEEAIMPMNNTFRSKAAGALDVDQLRSDWIGMVEYVQAARPRSNAMQSKRVLEEMLPFVRPDLVPPALQHAPAPAASTPTQEGQATGSGHNVRSSTTAVPTAPVKGPPRGAPPPPPPKKGTKPAKPAAPSSLSNASESAGHGIADSSGDKVATGSIASPKVKLLFWTKTPVQDGTIWSDFTNDEALLQPHLRSALHALFAQTPNALTTAGRREGRAAEVLKVVGLARANNVSIMLTQFADFKGGAADIQATVLSGAPLSIERLSLLCQMVPTEEEAKSFSGWLSKAGHSVEQLSAPERFLAVMGAVPRIRAKCAALLFRAQLPGLLADVHAALQCLLTACAQVRGSPRLRLVLAAALRAGNCLNEGSHLGDAKAVRIESLLRMADLQVTKTSRSMPHQEGASSEGRHLSAPTTAHQQPVNRIPPVRTLLDFVAWILHVDKHHMQGAAEQHHIADTQIVQSSRSISLRHEMGAVEDAAKRIQGDMAEALKTIDRGLAAAEPEYAACTAELNMSAAPTEDALSSGRSDSSDPAIFTGGAGSTAVVTFASGQPRNQANFDWQHSGCQAFTACLHSFLVEARSTRAQLVDDVAKAERCIADLAGFLGEPATSDPATLFAVIWAFAVAFDRAYIHMSQSFPS